MKNFSCFKLLGLMLLQCCGLMSCHRFSSKMDGLLFRCGIDGQSADLQWVEVYKGMQKERPEQLEVYGYDRELHATALPISPGGCFGLAADSSFSWIAARSEASGLWGRVMSSQELATTKRLQLAPIRPHSLNIECPRSSGRSDLITREDLALRLIDPSASRDTKTWMLKRQLTQNGLALSENQPIEPIELIQEQSLLMKWPELQPGSYQLQVEALDLLAAQGQQLLAQASCSFQIDRLLPKIIIRQSTASDLALSTESIAQVGPGEQLMLSNPLDEATSFYSCWQLGFEVVSKPCQFKEVTAELSAPISGDYQLLVYAEDRAGNKSPIESYKIAIFDADRVSAIRSEAALSMLRSQQKEDLLSLSAALRALHRTENLKSESEKKAVSDAVLEAAWQQLLNRGPIQSIESKIHPFDAVYPTQDSGLVILKGTLSSSSLAQMSVYDKYGKLQKQKNLAEIAGSEDSGLVFRKWIPASQQLVFLSRTKATLTFYDTRLEQAQVLPIDQDCLDGRSDETSDSSQVSLWSPTVSPKGRWMFIPCRDKTRVLEFHNKTWQEREPITEGALTRGARVKFAANEEFVLIITSDIDSQINEILNMSTRKAARISSLPGADTDINDYLLAQDDSIFCTIGSHIKCFQGAKSIDPKLYRTFELEEGLQLGPVVLQAKGSHLIVFEGEGRDARIASLDLSTGLKLSKRILDIDFFDDGVNRKQSIQGDVLSASFNSEDQIQLVTANGIHIVSPIDLVKGKGIDVSGGVRRYLPLPDNKAVIQSKSDSPKTDSLYLWNLLEQRVEQVLPFNNEDDFKVYPTPEGKIWCQTKADHELLLYRGFGLEPDLVTAFPGEIYIRPDTPVGLLVNSHNTHEFAVIDLANNRILVDQKLYQGSPGEEIAQAAIQPGTEEKIAVLKKGVGNVKIEIWQGWQNPALKVSLETPNIGVDMRWIDSDSLMLIIQDSPSQSRIQLRRAKDLSLKWERIFEEDFLRALNPEQIKVSADQQGHWIAISGVVTPGLDPEQNPPDGQAEVRVFHRNTGELFALMNFADLDTQTATTLSFNSTGDQLLIGTLGFWNNPGHVAAIWPFIAHPHSSATVLISHDKSILFASWLDNDQSVLSISGDGLVKASEVATGSSKNIFEMGSLSSDSLYHKGWDRLVLVSEGIVIGDRQGRQLQSLTAGFLISSTAQTEDSLWLNVETLGLIDLKTDRSRLIQRLCERAKYFIASHPSEDLMGKAMCPGL